MSLHIKPKHIFRAISVLKRSRQFRISLVEYKSLFSWRRPWCRCRRCLSSLREHVDGSYFLWSSPPSTLIPHVNRAFQKFSSNWRNFNTPVFCFGVDGKHFGNRVLENDDVTIVTWLPWPGFLKLTQIQNGRWLFCFQTDFPASCGEKHLMGFQSAKLNRFQISSSYWKRKGIED